MAVAFGSLGKTISTVMVLLATLALVSFAEESDGHDDHKSNRLRGLSLENDHLVRHLYEGDEEPPARPGLQPRIIGGNPVNVRVSLSLFCLTGRSLWRDVDFTKHCCHCGACEQFLSDVTVFADSIDVETRIIHPRSGEVFFADYDIMLLKLAEPSDQPYIQLNLDEDLPSVDDRLWVIGFGDTVPLELVFKQPSTLKEVELGYVSPEDCDLAYGYEDLIEEFMICTLSIDTEAVWYVLGRRIR